MKTTVVVNKSFDDKLNKMVELAEEEVKDRLEHVANYALFISPVDTGAYVESFSFTVGAGRPRGKSSANRPKVPRGEAVERARANLYSDLERFKLGSSDTITLRNNAPHAQKVEDIHGYSVFTKVRNKFG